MRSLASTLFSLLLPLVLYASPTACNCTITGTVTSADEVPIKGATVEISALSRGTTTGPDGFFSFDNLTEGRYTIAVRHLGFQTGEILVQLPEQDGEHIAVQLQDAVLDAPDVVVTASPLGRVTNYQPTMAYDAEQLHRSAGPSFGHMLDGEPGLAMRSAGPAPARPVIRGYDGERLIILENGERMGDISETAHDHAISLEPLAADRVEVVRGPASLLYGSNALGGVVNLITTDIPYEWEPGHLGSASLDVASMNQSVSGFGRYQYATDRWATTARISHRNAGDLSTPESTLPGTAMSNTEGSVGTSYTSENFSGGAALQFMDNVYGLPEAIDNPDERIEIRMDRQAAQSRMAWRSNGFFEVVSLRLHASRYFQQEVEMEEEENGSINEDIELEFLQHALSSTLQLQHAALGLIDAGMIGVNFVGRELEVGGDEVFTPGSRDGFIGLFTFQEMDLSKKASLQFGLRGETHRLKTIQNDFFPDHQADRSSFTWSGSLGLNIRPTSEIVMGAQLARAHRFPSLEELYADGPHFGIAAFEIGNPDLSDEIGRGLDVFTRYQSGRFNAEIAGFYNRLSNYVVFQPTGETDEASGFPIYRYEADDIEKWGAEASSGVLLTEMLEVGAVVDYVHGSRLDDARTPLPSMPPLRGRMEATYDRSSWWMGLTLRLVSGQNRVAPSEAATDGYTLLNVKGGVRLDGAGRHLISLRIDNTLNKTYRDHLSRVDERNSPMPGRNLQVTYRWIY